MKLPFSGQGAFAARRARRGAYLDLCRPLLANCVSGPTPHGFARLAGRHEGRRFDLQALPDALSYRKLPCLWLMVTLTEPMPVAGTTDIMMRPSGTEVFSRFADLPHAIALPPGFPAGAVLRTDAPRMLPTAIVADLAGLFAAQRLKEMVISPKGLRLVWLAEEADRTRYLLFRDSELGGKPAPAEAVRLLMDRLAMLARRLEDEAAARQGAA